MSNHIWVMVIALLFFWQENNYFGWNLHAQSDAELIADGIVMVILGISFAVRQK